MPYPSQFLDAHYAALSQELGSPLSAAALPSQSYTGPARLIVPTVRSVANEGEALALKIIALDQQPVKSVTAKLRPLGRGDWRKLPAPHHGRAVWQAQLPAATDDLEYFIEAQTADAKTLRWPATSPEINQTVLVAPRS